MLTRLKYAIEDYVLWPLGGLLYRINIFGRLRDAEQYIGKISDELRHSERAMLFGASEYEKAVSGLKEIVAVCNAVNSPNGTTRKIGRLASDTIDGLITEQTKAELERLYAEDAGDLFTPANDLDEEDVAA